MCARGKKKPLRTGSEGAGGVLGRMRLSEKALAHNLNHGGAGGDGGLGLDRELNASELGGV